VLCQFFHRGRQQIAAGAGGDVVENDGLVYLVRNGGEVGNKAILSGLVIVGGHHQQGIGPGLGGADGEVHGVLGIVGSGSGNDRNPARHPVNGKGNDLFPLLRGQGRAFAGGTHGHQGVDAAFQLEVNKPAQGFIVHPFRGHRCHHGRSHAFENCFLHRDSPFLISQFPQTFPCGEGGPPP